MGLFDIYSKEHRRIIMAKETIKEMLEMIDAKIEHIEDISADNRAIIVKLVKQSNQIVEFLKNLEIDIDEQYGIESPVSFSNSLQTDSNKIEELKELWEDFKSKREDLKEFEEELKKHKDKLTPGQVGDA
jgi:DNA repair ATPase RecN